MTIRELVNATETNERKAWRLIRKIEVVEERGGTLPEIANNQSNALRIAEAHIDSAIKKLNDSALARRLYMEEKEHFAR